MVSNDFSSEWFFKEFMLLTKIWKIVFWSQGGSRSWSTHTSDFLNFPCGFTTLKDEDFYSSLLVSKACFEPVKKTNLIFDRKIKKSHEFRSYFQVLAFFYVPVCGLIFYWTKIDWCCLFGSKINFMSFWLLWTKIITDTLVNQRIFYLFFI